MENPPQREQPAAATHVCEILELSGQRVAVVAASDPGNTEGSFPRVSRTALFAAAAGALKKRFGARFPELSRSFWWG